MTQRKRPVNLTLSEQQRDQLEELAKANAMSISGLVRFLATKAIDNPHSFGLLPVTQQKQG